MGRFSIFDAVQYGPRAALALRSGKFMGLILVFSTEGCSMSDLVSSDRSGVPRLFYDLSAVTGYSRTLDLDAAVGITRYEFDGVSVRQEAFVSAPDGVVVLRLTASQPQLA